jgi:hypothetical protein
MDPNQNINVALDSIDKSIMPFCYVVLPTSPSSSIIPQLQAFTQSLYFFSIMTSGFVFH